MAIYESGENYLETILTLNMRNGSVRSIDVANEMQFSRPSISRAMSVLKKAGYITMNRQGLIALTETGLEIASRIRERHDFLADVFMKMGVSEQTALEDACRVEHALSQETFNAIKAFTDKHIVNAD